MVSVSLSWFYGIQYRAPLLDDVNTQHLIQQLGVVGGSFSWRFDLT
jgi:hypothetical protein